MDGLRGIFDRTLGQAQLCLAAASSEGIDAMQEGAIVRGGIMLAISAFEHFNSALASNLVYRQIYNNPISEAGVKEDPRFDMWKEIYRTNQWKLDPYGRISPQSAQASVHRVTLNRCGQIANYLRIFVNDVDVIWDQAVENCSVNSRDELERVLSLFVDRRNDIAHTGDYNQVLLGLNSISSTDLKECLEVVSACAGAIEVNIRNSAEF